MDAFSLIGAGAGAYQGIKSAQEKLKEAQHEKDMLQRRWNSGLRNLGATSKILSGQLSLEAMQGTQSSKQGAVEAFKSESVAAAAAGASGLSGGTPFFNIGQQVASNRAILMDQATIIRQGLSNSEAKGAGAIGDIRDMIVDSKYNLDQSVEQLGYLSSTAAFMISAATGALSGASIGHGISTLGVKMGLGSDFGQVDFSKLFASGPFVGQAGSLNGLSDTLAGYSYWGNQGVDIPIVSPDDYNSIAWVGPNASKWGKFPDAGGESIFKHESNSGGILGGMFNSVKKSNPFQFALN
jgi:hypothetical protein